MAPMTCILLTPMPERLGLLRRNGLNRTEKLLGVGYVGVVEFTVCGLHFQLTTICSQLTSFPFKPGFKDTPVLARIGTIGQNADNIDYREKPFLLLIVPLCPYLTLLEELYGGLFAAHIAVSGKIVT